MVRSLWNSLGRTTRRRRIGLSLVVLAAGLATWAGWRGDPALSPVERAMIGEWGRAETDPRFSFVTPARGLMTTPWIVQEFASDRTYRQWLVSADDTRNHFLHVQGRWRVVDGVIQFEEPPLGVRRIVENAGTQIGRLSGLPLGSSSSLIGVRNIPFRLVGTDDLKLTYWNQDRSDWRRLSGSFKDQPRLLLQRAGSAAAALP